MPSPKREHVTNTGWRIVGAYEPNTAPPPVEPGRDEDVLYTMRVTIRTRMGTGSPVLPLLTTLNEAISEHWTDAPPLTLARAVEREPQRFHGLKWQPSGTMDAWNATLLWRHPHPEAAGAPCTTQVLLNAQNGTGTMAIRITADNGVSSVRGIIGAGLARPKFLAALQQRVRVSFAGIECRPHELTLGDMPNFVRNVLLGDREIPVAVLSPFEASGYAIDPAALSAELMGLAHLYVMDRQPTSFELSDQLGDRRLSCYWGALRVYMPSFSCADRPDEHPLLQQERVADPIERARLIGNLARFAQGWVRDFTVEADINAATAANTVPPGAETSVPVMPALLAEKVVARSVLDKTEGAHPDAEEAPVVQPNAAQPNRVQADRTSTEMVATSAPFADNAGPAVTAPVLAPFDDTIAAAIRAIAESAVNATRTFEQVVSRMDGRLEQMSTVLTGLAEVNRALVEEVVRLRSVSTARNAGSNVGDRRMQSLEQSVRSVLNAVRNDAVQPSAAPELQAEPDVDEDAISLVEVVRQAAASYPETLLVLESAESSAADSPYLERDRVAQVLDIMAEVADRRRGGALGSSLREVFRAYGVEYRGGIASSTSEKQKRQYAGKGPDGTEYECHEHIVLGSGYDPRYCFRIYFTSRAPLEPRFVVAHAGRHHDVKSST